ncbi:DJ-1 family protein [Candidatus Omnitrophus magneticus]|uniref:DJ-1 family protein n=1 Tax=Candidatus Omnitrophus magneticus TaxID=1609969 RepID=A0A0F0CUH5_9BACT|nr:DJ-1 family protein [Candidatus Omnitrophus magneticus]
MASKKEVLIVLADGFEEVEAITPIDVLRRGGVNVVISGLNGQMVTSSRKITIKADIAFNDYNGDPDVLILPGGMPGTENLAKSVKLKDMIKKMNSKKKIIAAICAAPAIILAPLGILDNKRATCYPGMEENFSSLVKFGEEKVVRDGNIITSRGPATASNFALLILEQLAGKEVASVIAQGMLFAE